MDGGLLLAWLWALATPGLLVELPEERGQDYQVVRPIKVHSLHRRNSQSSWPDEVSYALTVSGTAMVMWLERNTALLSTGFTETHYTSNGTRITSTQTDLDHCYYQGRIVNDSESLVSISACKGLRGYLKTALKQYLIEPLSGNDTGDHSLRPYQKPESTCGVTNTSWEPAVPFATTGGHSKASPASLLKAKKKVELFLVVDNRLYQQLRRNLAAVRRRMLQMVNFANAVYQPLSTSVVLAGLEVWSNRDQILVSASPTQTLSRFTSWRSRDLLRRRPHDNAQLITGVDLTGATLGVAGVGSMCSVRSTGVVQDYRSQVVAVAATLAHELGHNLGMVHDAAGCSCGAREPCIMAAVLGPQVPRLFSGCSRQRYGQFLIARAPRCLFERPDVEPTINPLCGNGILDTGEECDCGREGTCLNPCCHASTCTLTAGSNCATGECCKSCRVECRGQRDECDLAEFCSGKSTQCPPDVFAQNGVPCRDGRGYCRDGGCPLLADQCIRTWGDTARVGQNLCYEQNTQGTSSAFCRRAGPEEYIPCQEKDVMCGKLFCTGGNGQPSSGQAKEISDCKTTVNNDPSQEQGLVEAGTRCGDGLVCMDNQCVDLETAYSVTNCKAQCKGHAVCNHLSQCVCEPGWVPPDCQALDDSDQGLPTGTIIAIAVGTGVATVILLALIGLAGHLKHGWALSDPLSLPPQMGDLDQNNPTFPA